MGVQTQSARSHVHLVFAQHDACTSPQSLHGPCEILGLGFRQNWLGKKGRSNRIIHDDKPGWG
jgi:hypothetical protein